MREYFFRESYAIGRNLYLRQPRLALHLLLTLLLICANNKQKENYAEQFSLCNILWVYYFILLRVISYYT